jgi:hypothetical protein
MSMFRALGKLFRKEEAPKEPFVDPVLGQFTFERRLGWKKQIVLGDTRAELVLGSDGEAPSEQMLRTAKSWVDQWQIEFPKIIDYIRRELLGWSGESALPVPEKFEIESINILWSDKPETSMVYFHYPGDDVRCWHRTSMVPAVFRFLGCDHTTIRNGWEMVHV